MSLDIWDTLGTNMIDIQKDITKYTVDKHGMKQYFHGRNKKQKKVEHETHHKDTIQHISDANGGSLHSTDLSPDTIQAFHSQYEHTFIDYFASWCIHCQRLAPTWEKFAQELSQQNTHQLGIGKVDCVSHDKMCKDERIMAFPTLRWYTNGKVDSSMPDYRGDRTVDALVEYAKKRVGSNEDGDDDDETADDNNDADDQQWLYNHAHHPGCQVSGHLMVNRVPGNLHMEASSTNHEINSQMTNLTHRVHHFSFGSSDNGSPPGYLISRIPSYRDNLPQTIVYNTNPLADKYYPTYHFHQAFHHHLKIISTHITDRGILFNDNTILYQILEESQLIMYQVVNVPEIKFLYDMSPMSVALTLESELPWYDYISKLLAIIGGTYVTLGLINSIFLRVFKPKKI